METTLSTPVAVKTPRTTLAQLTSLALVGVGLSFLYLQTVIIGSFEPPLTVLMIVAFLLAIISLARKRWTPLLGAFFGVMNIAMNIDNIVIDFMHPNDLKPFIFIMIITSCSALAGIFGFSAFVQNYSTAPENRRLPRWSPLLLVVVAALIVGAAISAAIPRPGTSVGVSPEFLAAVPSLNAQNYAFDQTSLNVKAGTATVIRLGNADSATHYFEIDELDVHAPIPPGQEGLALFRPSKPGTYIFYCSPHYNKQTGEGMKGTLVVAP